jgi:serine-type D-Ala-D-Ala endopeptidase (penicillin-binding protein 7)
MNKHFTLTEWLVVFAVLFFLVIQSADAKQKHKHKPHRKHVAKTRVVREYVPDTLSVMVTNVTENIITRSQNIDQIRPLASMTKLMTAMVALDHDKNMDRKLVLSRLAGSKMPKQEYTRGELFHMLLIKSDNAAAETLANDYPGGRENFIRDMNIRAMMLTMHSTKFDDPSGLSPHNVSTASDVTQMVVAASSFVEIRDISTKKTATIEVDGRRRSRVTILHNTNHAILSQVNGVQVSKTGYTNLAGFCVALLVHKQNGDKEYHEVIIVMGARSPSQRVDTVKKVAYNDMKEDNHVTPNRI